MIFKKLIPAFLFASSLAIYDPSTGADWSLLKPASPRPKGAVSSLPFPVGIVTQPFLYVNGKWEAPSRLDHETDHQESKKHRQSFPTKCADIQQMEIGQVLRPDDLDLDCEGDWVDSDDPLREDFGDDSDESCEEESEDWHAPEVPWEGPEEEDCEEWEVPEYEEVIDDGSVVGGPVNIVPEYKFIRAKREKRVFESRDYLQHPIKYSSCTEEDTLVMYLDKGILRDPEERIGCIVGNHQFQFDGPTPQYGAIYAAGWLVTRDSLLSLGSKTTFYQCLAGEFHKTYDVAIHDQCVPVQFEVVKLDKAC